MVIQNNHLKSKGANMFVIYAKSTTTDDHPDYLKALKDLMTSAKQYTPKQVEILGRGVWFINNVEDLSFLAVLGAEVGNKPLQLKVKGLQPK